jgi:hypothetical protein
MRVGAAADDMDRYCHRAEEAIFFTGPSIASGLPFYDKIASKGMYFVAASGDVHCSIQQIIQSAMMFKFA